MTDPVNNEFGQPIGRGVPDWTAPPYPGREVLVGRHCVCEPLDERHACSLYDAFSLDVDDRNWTYLPYGPFASRGDYRDWVEQYSDRIDPQMFAIIDGPSQKPLGVAGYLRIFPDSGSIEVGHLRFSKLLQHTTAATEAMYLMMRLAFDLGYRRYEWKCDALNAPSRAAALRLGFTYEGIFRNATVYKGRSRDTAWYSIIDTEWPAIDSAFRAWLHPSNFDEEGKQLTRLNVVMVDRRSGTSIRT